MSEHNKKISLSEYLQNYLREHDENIRSFALRSGISYNHARTLVVGERSTERISTLQKVADATGVSLTTLVKILGLYKDEDEDTNYDVLRSIINIIKSIDNEEDLVKILSFVELFKK